MQPSVTRALGLAGWIGVSFAAAAVGGIAAVEAGDFYRQLVRPPWAPPAWLFGPVWTVLYLLMGIAAWRVWSDRGFRGARNALTLFLVQLAVNAAWTWLFFVWRLGALALADILLLDALLAATVVAFWRVQAVAGALLLPYLVWVLYASALTYAVWQANPAVLS